MTAFDSPELRELTVLVVDDDPTMRELIEASVSGLAVRVLSAVSAEEGLALAEQNELDVALLDRMLPGMQGAELCAKLRGREGGEFTQILMLTAEDSLDARLSCFDSGADDFVAKPFHHRELLARVKALLRVSILQRRLAKQNAELYQAQEQLKEHERLQALADIAATAAHELGQPISAILLNIHLLKKSLLDQDRTESVIASIEADVQRLAKLTEQLRDIKSPRSREYFERAHILSLDEGDSES